MKKIVLYILNLYQNILSPDHSFWAKSLNKPPYCMHIPSCSEYTKEAIEKKWVFKGVLLGIWRILRCMPWNKWWYDPIDKNK